MSAKKAKAKAAPEAKAGAEAGEGKKKGGKKKLVLIALVLLLVGGGAGGWFSGVIPRLLGHGEAQAAEAEAGEGHPAKGGEKAAEKAGEKGGHAAEGHAEKGGEKAGEKGEKGEHGAKSEARAKGDPLFMDLPDIIANLNNGGHRAAYVKLRAKLELSKPEDQVALQAAMPRVLDLFQGYLREMRPEELRGTAGTYRLREELLARTNLAAPPARVVAVLFTEMIVQ